MSKIEETYKPEVQGPISFMDQFAEILGENFLVKDTICQDDLFEIQDKLGVLICEAANNRSSYTRRVVEKLIELNPITFKYIGDD